MNVRCVSAICIATIAFAVSAKAQFVPIVVLVERIPAGSRPAGGWTTSSSVNAEYVSWTIPAGVRYDGVIINAHLSGVGGTGTGTAYLYSAPGTSGTLTSGAALVAANAVSVTGNVPDFAPTNLFQGLTLSASSGPVTYYLLLVPSNSFLAWDTSVATTTYTAAGVTSNPDQGATAAVASPPSASTWSALSPNGMLFEVFTFTPPSTIGTTAAAPSLSPAVLFLAALLLGSLGWLLVAPQAIENGKRRYGGRHPRNFPATGDAADARGQFQQGLLFGTGDRGADPRAGAGKQEVDARGVGGGRGAGRRHEDYGGGAEAEVTSAVVSPASGEVVALAYVRQ